MTERSSNTHRKQQKETTFTFGQTTFCNSSMAHPAKQDSQIRPTTETTRHRGLAFVMVTTEPG